MMMGEGAGGRGRRETALAACRAGAQKLRAGRLRAQGHTAAKVGAHIQSQPPAPVRGSGSRVLRKDVFSHFCLRALDPSQGSSKYGLRTWDLAWNAFPGPTRTCWIRARGRPSNRCERPS